MVKTCNIHCREAGRVVQITCEVNVQKEFLRLISVAQIRKTEAGTDLQELFTENPASREPYGRTTDENRSKMAALRGSGHTKFEEIG